MNAKTRINEVHNDTENCEKAGKPRATTGLRDIPKGFKVIIYICVCVYVSVCMHYNEKGWVHVYWVNTGYQHK